MSFFGIPKGLYTGKRRGKRASASPEDSERGGGSWRDVELIGRFSDSLVTCGNTTVDLDFTR